MNFTDTSTPSFQDFASQYQRPGAPGMTTAQINDLRDTWNQMYYPNAFQAAMMNYQNEWQSPASQMLRYQSAGLNPYSFQAQQSAGGSQGAAPKQMLGNQELNQKKISNLISGVSTLSGVLGVAKELYDYIKFGKDRSMWQTALTQHQVGAAAATSRIKEQEAAWAEYWNGAQYEYYGDDGDGNPLFSSTKRVPKDSPRARYMEQSTRRIIHQINQLSYMVETLYPSQKAANEARAALMDYQKQIMQGHNDAVLNLNTGNQTVDSIIKFLLYLISENLPSFGFTGKL